MKSLSSILGILIFFILPPAYAQDLIRLYEMHAPQMIRPFIIPVKLNETPAQAAARYTRELARQPELMELFEGRAPDLSQAEFKPLGSTETVESRALLMANLPRDYTKTSARVENFGNAFADKGTNSYILPINANLGLTQNETRDLFRQIANEFPLLINLGGDDVDPRFYKKENFHARNTIPFRDQFEIALIKSYIAAEKGFHFAVCRGAQITAIAMGYKMIQDIPLHIRGAISHAHANYPAEVAMHPIELIKTTHGMLAGAVKNFKDLTVNSIHHQSIIFHEGGPLELAAVGPDGITEALESKNGRTFITQWHPELMNNALGLAILNKVIVQKNTLFRNRCQNLF